MTLDGTLSDELLLEMDTTESVAAAVFRVTAHLPALWLVIAVGEQDTDLGPFLALWAMSEKDLETPLRPAVN